MAKEMSYIQEHRAWQKIMDRGFPYPWDFHLGSETGFAEKDYHKYWAYTESELSLTGEKK